MTTGTTTGRDRGRAIWRVACGPSTRAVPGLPVQVQCEPPGDLRPGAHCSELRDAGADAIGIHVESLDDAVRRTLDAGQGRQCRSRSTGGLATRRSGSSAATRSPPTCWSGSARTPTSWSPARGELIAAGIYPFVVPFRPLAGTLAADVDTCPGPGRTGRRRHLRVAGALRAAGMRGADQSAGCAACGACSALRPPAAECSAAQSHATEESDDRHPDRRRRRRFGRDLEAAFDTIARWSPRRGPTASACWSCPRRPRRLPRRPLRRTPRRPPARRRCGSTAPRSAGWPTSPATWSSAPASARPIRRRGRALQQRRAVSDGASSAATARCTSRCARMRRTQPAPCFAAFDTPVGRMGMLICYDKAFPEAARSLAVRGRRDHRLPVRVAGQPYRTRRRTSPTTGGPSASTCSTGRGRWRTRWSGSRPTRRDASARCVSSAAPRWSTRAATSSPRPARAPGMAVAEVDIDAGAGRRPAGDVPPAGPAAGAAMPAGRRGPAGDWCRREPSCGGRRGGPLRPGSAGSACERVAPIVRHARAQAGVRLLVLPHATLGGYLADLRRPRTRISCPRPSAPTTRSSRDSRARRRHGGLPRLRRAGRRASATTRRSASTATACSVATARCTSRRARPSGTRRATSSAPSTPRSVASAC